MKQAREKIVVSSILLLVVIQFIANLYNSWSFFTRPFPAEKIGQIYTHSQYVEGSGSTGIGDDGLYAFAGNYLIQGGDPTQVNFENPPLAKYLIGLSIVLFRNENGIYPVYAALILIGTYILTRHVGGNSLTAAAAVLVLAFSHLFIIQYMPTNKAQMGVTLLDLPVTLFFMYGIIAFLKAKATPVFYLFAGVLFGCAFSSKFFPILVLLTIPFAWYVLQYDRKHLKIFFVSLIVIPVVYGASYSMFFVQHPSLIAFINFQKYVIGWRLGNPTRFANIILTVFTGKYRSWWNEAFITDQEWSIDLPIIVLLGFIGAVVSFYTRNKQLQLLSVICVVMFVYLAVGSVGIARYLLPIYPLFVILGATVSVTIFVILKKQWKKIRPTPLAIRR